MDNNLIKDFIEINKFSELHDGEKIVFCKTDFLYQEFEEIKKINNDVILISGNSDYPITENYLNSLPKNVKKWYAQNALANSDVLEPIPLGLENKLPSVRQGHGIGYYDRVLEKENLLSRNVNTESTKFMYSNFRIETNYQQRIIYKKISINESHIDWEESNLSLTQFFDKILEYKMVLCPLGNGVDTHRLWEVLYSGRIPVTVKCGNYKIYELYEKLPIIILNSIDDLRNKNLIEEKYQKIMEKNHNLDLLDFNFWFKKILNER